MKEKQLIDEEFIKKYEAFENETTEDFIKKYSRTETELRDTIAYLIRHREMLKVVEIRKLESESRKLVERLKDINHKKLLEEIECFKEILVLQKQLLKDNHGPI